MPPLLLLISMTVDKEAQSRFEEALKKAMVYYKRSTSETCNRTLYAIASAACNTTKAATKDEIRNSLLQMSQLYDKAPLAAILINKGRNPGLQGPQMEAAVEKFIRKRQAGRNSLRAGYISARKALGAVLSKGKGGAPRIPPGIRVRGRPKGGADPAKEGWKTGGAIFNTMEGKTNKGYVQELEQEGLNAAVAAETKSKLDYVLKKQMEEGYVIFNKA